MTHPSDEAVFALAGQPAGDVETDPHVRQCVPCRQRVARARVLRQAVAEAPRALEPPADWWPSVRAAIESGRRARGGVKTGQRQMPQGMRRRLVAWPVAAAFVIGVLVSAAAVLVALRRERPAPSMAGPIDVRPVPRASLPIAVSTQPADASNDTEVERRLLAELELRKGELRPATVEQVEANLHAINRAIADVRSKLAHDPDNPALRQLLAASYAHKVDLLKILGNAS